MCVYFAVIYPEPFSKGSYKQQHKQIENETMTDHENIQPSASGAVLKRELIDSTVITGAL